MWHPKISCLPMISLLAVAACTSAPTSNPQSAAAKPVLVKWNADHYPSTYKAYPSTPTAIRGATILDGEGGKIERGYFSSLFYFCP